MNLQPLHLHDSRLQLVPLRRNDFERLYSVASDPLIWEQHPTKDRYKREVFQSFFDSAIDGKAAFLIVDAKTNEPIGSSRYYEYDEAKKSIAIGYTFLARKYWGGNWNQALKKLMLDYAFQFVDKVIFHIGEHNLRSQIATQRFGAKKLDRIKEKANGSQVVRNFVYELKKEDWNQHNQ
ncbi:MAG: GNAT family N-acetyltransferase [Chryseotalea sp. WA131a]|nr:MAG: GNAT family N-acetyltransferase [Chryseotalea sp. WA131a]